MTNSRWVVALIGVGIGAAAVHSGAGARAAAALPGAKPGRGPARQAHVEKARAAYARLPLSFEQNRGQADGRVRFISRGSGYTLFLTPVEAVLALRKSEATKVGLGDAAPPSVKAALP